MLNTKYIILSANSTPIENTARSGNAWFVENYQLVDTPDEEILSLKAIDPEKTAIIGRDFAQAVAGKNIRFDSTATIQLTSYAPNKLTYKTKASQEQLAIPKAGKLTSTTNPVNYSVPIIFYEACLFRQGNILLL